jgi:hypothetical protein
VTELPDDFDECIDALTAALTTWAARDDATAQPEVRRAGTAAVTATDRLIASLHAMRLNLVSEIRRSDDAAAIRVDALLSDGSEDR